MTKSISLRSDCREGTKNRHKYILKEAANKLSFSNEVLRVKGNIIACCLLETDDLPWARGWQPAVPDY